MNKVCSFTLKVYDGSLSNMVYLCVICYRGVGIQLFFRQSKLFDGEVWINLIQGHIKSSTLDYNLFLEVAGHYWP